MSAMFPGSKFLRTTKASRLHLLFRKWRCKESVLISLETTVLEYEMISIRIDSECLTCDIALTGFITESQIISIKMIGINEKRRSSESTALLSIRKKAPSE